MKDIKVNDNLITFVIERIREFGGKMAIEKWMRYDFSFFMYTLLRYKNESLLLDLTPLLNETATWLRLFWQETLRGDPITASEYLYYNVMNKEKIPEWDSVHFYYYLEQRRIYFEPEKNWTKEKAFGPAKPRAYILHTKTPYFQCLLKAADLPAAMAIEMLDDWVDVFKEFKPQQKKANSPILNAILLQSFQVLENLHLQLYSMKKVMDHKTKEEPVKTISADIWRLLKTIEHIILTKQHAFTKKELNQIAEKYFTAWIVLGRSNPDDYEYEGVRYFLFKAGKDYSVSAVFNELQSTSSFTQKAKTWGAEKLKEVNLKFGKLKIIKGEKYETVYEERT